MDPALSKLIARVEALEADAGQGEGAAGLQGRVDDLAKAVEVFGQALQSFDRILGAHADKVHAAVDARLQAIEERTDLHAADIDDHRAKLQAIEEGSANVAALDRRVNDLEEALTKPAGVSDGARVAWVDPIE